MRESLPGREAPESLPLKELNRELKPDILFDEKGPYTKPPQAGKNEPQKQPEGRCGRKESP